MTLATLRGQGTRSPRITRDDRCYAPEVPYVPTQVQAPTENR
jgi:hypothetical protein